MPLDFAVLAFEGHHFGLSVLIDIEDDQIADDHGGKSRTVIAFVFAEVLRPERFAGIVPGPDADFGAIPEHGVHPFAIGRRRGGGEAVAGVGLRGLAVEIVLPLHRAGFLVEREQGALAAIGRRGLQEDQPLGNHRRRIPPPGHFDFPHEALRVQSGRDSLFVDGPETVGSAKPGPVGRRRRAGEKEQRNCGKPSNVHGFTRC